MSLDKSAIEFIQNTAVSRVAVESDTPAILVPNGMALESTEHLQGARSRFRGCMSTPVVGDFLAYVSAQAASSCFIDIDEMSAKTIFNLGDDDNPGHGDHKAILTLRKTPDFSEVLRVDGLRMRQKVMAEWLEDWHENLVPISPHDDDDEEVAIKSAVNSIRRVTIDAARGENHAVDDFKSERTTMEEIEAPRKTGTLPAGFMFSCRPYLELERRSFYLRMSLLAGEGEGAPVFVLRIVWLDNHLVAMGEEFSSLLEEQMSGLQVNIYVGNFLL